MKTTIITIAACFAFLSFAFDTSTPIAVAKPITLAYQTPTLGSNLPIFVAAELGLFAADNLELKTVFIQGGPTAMAALIGVRKRNFGDPMLIRRVIHHFAEFYSIGITKEDIEELAKIGKVEGEMKKIGGAERMFLGPLVAKALAQTR